MKRIGTIFVAIALVGALAAIPLGATAFANDSAQANATEHASENASVQPGERLAGVAGVQSAEINGEVSERAFGIKIANASTDEAKADVVGERLAEVEDRLEEHEAELEELEEAREAGEISDGEYRAKVAAVAAENAATERAAERTGAAAAELPEDVLSERGIDVEAIETLRADANELGGPETAEIARSIAGDETGAPVPGDLEPGAPGGTGNGSEVGSTDGDVDSANETVDEDERGEGPAGDGQSS